LTCGPSCDIERGRNSRYRKPSPARRHTRNRHRAGPRVRKLNALRVLRPHRHASELRREWRCAYISRGGAGARPSASRNSRTGQRDHHASTATDQSQFARHAPSTLRRESHLNCHPSARANTQRHAHTNDTKAGAGYRITRDRRYCAAGIGDGHARRMGLADPYSPEIHGSWRRSELLAGLCSGRSARSKPSQQHRSKETRKKGSGTAKKKM